MPWLLQNWHSTLGEPLANALLALVAVACGTIVGAEREKKEKPAGLRTLTLVSLGSAVFTMVCVSFDRTETGRLAIAAQIVSGIGFLGAGAILRGAAGVTGMTTAAAIWIISAIGMTVGAGYAVAGLALSLLVVAVLTVISTLEFRYLGHCEPRTVLVTFDPSGGKAVIKIEALLDEYHIDHRPFELCTTADGRKQLRVTYCDAHRHHRELLAHLAGMPEVLEIHRESPVRPPAPH